MKRGSRNQATTTSPSENPAGSSDPAGAPLHGTGAREIKSEAPRASARGILAKASKYVAVNSFKELLGYQHYSEHAIAYWQAEYEKDKSVGSLLFEGTGVILYKGEINTEGLEIVTI